MKKNKLIRVTTVPASLRTLLKGQLRFMSQYYEVIGISSPEDALLEVEKNEGVKTIPILMTRTLSPLRDLKSMWKLYRIFKKENPLIVHTHTPKAGAIGMIAAKIANVPYRLHTVAGMPLLEIKGPKRKLLDFVEKITYMCATKVYPNSNKLYNVILKNNYIPKSKLKVLANGSSNGIDTSFFDPGMVSDHLKHSLKNELNLSDNNFIFCFIGRLVKDKGIAELVQSFIEISKEYQHAKLLILGNMDQKKDPILPATKEEILNHPDIIFVGYQKDIRPYLAISDVFVFPSYREGFPNVVMQAGAMGLPCIVTDINGCNEVIEDGINGVIIPPKNVDQLKAKMLLFLENPDLRIQLKPNARKMITSRYEQKMVWNSLLSEYENLTNKNNGHI